MTTDVPTQTGGALRATVAVLAAGAGGFLARPCCVLPALFAATGTGSAVLTRMTVTHRSAFEIVSVLLLGTSMWLNVRMQARPVNRWIAGVAAVLSFTAASRPGWLEWLF